MTLTPKQLAAYAKVAQKYGITEFNIDGNYVKLELHTPASSAIAPAIPADILTPDALTEEQLLYYSVR